jgi:hypothetical protein
LSDPLALGEQILALLDQSARSSTYKPAVLLALIDRAQEHLDTDSILVAAIAERVIELYWPQTLSYPTTGKALLQNQAGGQALIVAEVVKFRLETRSRSRELPEPARRTPSWSRLLDRVELTLAEWPIPRLQRPFGEFLYSFGWPWEGSTGWSTRAYRASSSTITLQSGVGEAITSLGPLLRPFIVRWWTDKAARLNPGVEAARSVVEFEEFLFGRDRVSLERVGEDLLSLQRRRHCFYCDRPIRKDLEVDHFIPWSHSGDDGLDNLVAACRSCNNEKRATLPGPRHVADLLERNSARRTDMQAVADLRRWPRNSRRSALVARAAYARAPGGGHVWTRTRTTGTLKDWHLTEPHWYA